MDKQKNAFTLVELSITIIIIAILASIGLYSYVGYIGEARDVERKANIGEIKTALKLYKQKRGFYSIPGDYFNILNDGKIVALQGVLNENVTLSTMDKIPFDPFTGNKYFYSITKNKQEFEIALTLEDGEFPSTLSEGDYKTVSKNVLPSILLATGATTDVEIHDLIGNGTTNRNLFIFDGGLNLPYTIIKPHLPLYAGENVDDVLSDGNINFWQNSDYRTCDEILEAAKMIHDSGLEEYQILDDTGVLVNTGCTLP
ncbi:MAG: prepilin-type N-terminal cleavage/methylation domain-containing protein [Candidatus Gracilibacteria bacterium]